MKLDISFKHFPSVFTSSILLSVFYEQFSVPSLAFILNLEITTKTGTIVILQ